MLESTWQWFLGGGSQQILLTAYFFLLIGLFLGKRMRSPREDKQPAASNRGDSSFLKGYNTSCPRTTTRPSRSLQNLFK